MHDTIPCFIHVLLLEISFWSDSPFFGTRLWLDHLKFMRRLPVSNSWMSLYCAWLILSGQIQHFSAVPHRMEGPKPFRRHLFSTKTNWQTLEKLGAAAAEQGAQLQEAQAELGGLGIRTKRRCFILAENVWTSRIVGRGGTNNSLEKFESRDERVKKRTERKELKIFCAF